MRTLPAIAALLAFAACTGPRPVASAPGVLRSAQAGEDRLARAIDAHGLRTIACLRGDGEGAAESARAAAAAGAAFWHIPMSATRPPSAPTLLALWRLAAEAERPLLLHCRAGVDRTGLAAAIATLHDTGDLELARRELALLPHGHAGLFGTAAMDAVLDAYAPWQRTLSFPDWVRRVWATSPTGALR